MGLFNFLGTTLRGGGDSYSQAVSSELANYRERGVQPYERADARSLASDRRNAAIQTTRTREAMEHNAKVSEDLARSRPAIDLPNVDFNVGAYSDPSAQPLPAPAAPADGSYAPGEFEAWWAAQGAAAPAKEATPTGSKFLDSAMTALEASPSYDAGSTLVTLEQQLADMRQGYDIGVYQAIREGNKPLRDPTIRRRVERRMAELEAQIAGLRARGVTPSTPAANAPYTDAVPGDIPIAPVDLKPPSAAVTATPSNSGYQQFAATVDAIAPQLGFNVDEAHALMAGLGYGESQFNANAKSPSGTYTGAYQLGPDIIKKYAPRLKSMGVTPDSPEGQAAMALMLAADNKKVLLGKGIQPTPANLALAHNQGATGAVALLTHPNMPAGEALEKFAPDKASGAKRAAGQAWMAGRDPAQVTAGEFVRMAGAYYSRYQTTPAEALQSGTGMPGLNTQPYMQEPGRVSLDLQIAEYYLQEQQSQYEELQALYAAAQQRSAYGDPDGHTQRLLALSDKMREARLNTVQSTTTGIMLQAYQGLNLAQGGKTGLLGAALTEITGSNYQIIPYTSQDGTALFYGLQVEGSPVGAPMSYEQLVSEVRQRIDRGYAEALMAAQAETKSALALKDYDHRAAIELAGVEGYFKTAGAIAIEKAARGEGLQPTKESTPDGAPIFQDPNTGDLYEYTLRTEKLDGKNVTTPSFERIYY